MQDNKKTETLKINLNVVRYWKDLSSVAYIKTNWPSFSTIFLNLNIFVLGKNTFIHNELFSKLFNFFQIIFDEFKMCFVFWFMRVDWHNSYLYCVVVMPICLAHFYTMFWHLHAYCLFNWNIYIEFTLKMWIWLVYYVYLLYRYSQLWVESTQLILRIVFFRANILPTKFQTRNFLSAIGFLEVQRSL